jgi:hypothetical protein
VKLLRAGLVFGISVQAALGQDAVARLPFEVALDVVHQEFGGTFCWFHPRAGVIPGAGADGGPSVVLTMQKYFLSASDYFSGLSVTRTDDLGRSWTAPEARPELAWREEPGGITVGICDFTPGWHAPTGKLLAIGHTVRYKDEKLMKDPRPRETGYSYYDPATGVWAPWRTLEMPDDPKYFSAGAGCTQWLVEPDGTLLVPIYFKPKSEDPRTTMSATVLRCTFDGDTLRLVAQGSEHTVADPRGCGEPSITKFQGKYYMTIRNDVRGYVTTSADGLHYEEIRPWTFCDGEELGSYNTQQHWVTHSDALFLAYTRRGADNDHIMRNRAPLFIAQVDAEKLCVLRDTEQVLVPERGATLGNFGVVMVNENESWVTVGEGMYGDAAARGAEGAVFAARVIWSKPNQLAREVLD